MTTPQNNPAPAKTIRLIHAAMIVGVLLFAVVGHFVLRPTMMSSGSFLSDFATPLLGIALGAIPLALLLRSRVPRRSPDMSPDTFWTMATQHALLAWTPLEAGSLLSILVYASTGQFVALGVAAAVIVVFAALNPGHFESR